MSNTLRQVKYSDLYFLTEMIEKSVNWYIRHCEEITELAEFFQEEEDEVYKEIMDKGLREMQNIRDMMSEAKKGDEL